MSPGADVVTNGAFDSDTGWTKGTGWTIGSNVASSDGSQSADSDLEQAQTLTDGVKFAVTFTISNYSAGNATPVVGGVEGTDRAANGTFTEEITSSTADTLAIRADLDFIGDIDDVILLPVGDDWNDAFVDYANGDFRIKSISSVLHQAGLSNSSDSEVPTEDIAGNPRVDGSESIGAWEFGPINTAEKRRSVAALMRGIPMVTPNAAKDAEWRLQAGRNYSGIAVAAPAAGGPAPGSLMQTGIGR